MCPPPVGRRSRGHTTGHDVSSTTFSLIAIGLLVLINGFFVAAEFALVSLRPEQPPASGVGHCVGKGHHHAFDRHIHLSSAVSHAGRNQLVSESIPKKPDARYVPSFNTVSRDALQPAVSDIADKTRRFARPGILDAALRGSRLRPGQPSHPRRWRR